MIELITSGIAAASHQILVFKRGVLSFMEILDGAQFWPLNILLSCTSYFYLVAHFTHRSYDITITDVIVVLAMQVSCFTVCGDLYIRSLPLFFCICICFYRYAAYAGPTVIPHPKRESEDVPV